MADNSNTRDPHPSPKDLEAYFQDWLSEDRSTDIERHFGRCGQCRALANRMSASLRALDEWSAASHGAATGMVSPSDMPSSVAAPAAVRTAAGSAVQIVKAAFKVAFYGLRHAVEIVAYPEMVPQAAMQLGTLGPPLRAHGTREPLTRTALLVAKDMPPVRVEIDAASHTVTVAFPQIAKPQLVVMMPDRMVLDVRAALANIESKSVCFENLADAEWDVLIFAGSESSPEASTESLLRVYDEALSETDKVQSPGRWADLQNRLGILWTLIPTGDRSVDLHRAIECFESALFTLPTQQSGLLQAVVQSNLAATHRKIG